MALKTYIGARYAPKFSGAWDKTHEYGALEVVYANNQSYVSRKTVPANTEITNTEFWIKSADWNAQVAQYNANVEQYNANVEQYNTNVKQYEQNVSSFYADTMHSYDTKQDMVDDQTLKLGETLLTCGNASVGDGGGGFWQVVAETSANAVALKNGLFALRVQLEPYNAVVYHNKAPKFTKQGTGNVTYLLDISDATTDSIHIYNKAITGNILDGFVNEVTVKVNIWSSLIVNGIIKLYIQAAPLSTKALVPYTVTTATGMVLCKASSYNNSTIGINLYMVNGKVEYADTFTKEVEAPAVMPSETVVVNGTTSLLGTAGVLTLSAFNANHKCPTRVINAEKTDPGFTATITSLNINIQTTDARLQATDIFNGETIIKVTLPYTNLSERNIAVTLSVNGNNVIGTQWIGGNKITGNGGVISNQIRFIVKISGADTERIAQIFTLE